jgi:hypothetical protein
MTAGMRLKGTPVAEKQSELKALSELAAETQSKVLDLILAPVPKAVSVADALVLLAGRPPLSDAEQQFKRVSNSLSKLNVSGRAAVFRQHIGQRSSISPSGISPGGRVGLMRRPRDPYTIDMFTGWTPPW